MYLKIWGMLDPLIILISACFVLTQKDSCAQSVQSRKLNEASLKNEDHSKIHPCRRMCELGEPPMLCKYDFEVDWYRTLTPACRNCPYNVKDCFLKDCIPGDGMKRAIVVVNKKLPGPSIEVCKNDIVVVDVKNNMYSEPTTIHWHGQPQTDTPYMDGVPYITQCPIQPCNSFRYTFNASQAGTHFWHSHIGMQRVDGVFGPLIVRVPKEEDFHRHLYDHDLPAHVMVVHEWDWIVGGDMLLEHLYAGGTASPPSLLVNGLGRFKQFYKGGETISVPTARFKVEKGYSYRFRLINSGSLNCPIEMTIDNHMITVISSDGVDIKPIEATSLISYAGERFDFVLHATKPKDLYWIKFKGLINCSDKKAFQVAVLEYNGLNVPSNSYPDGTINYFNAHNEGIQVNPLNKGIESDESVVPLTRMQSVEGWDESLKTIPDFQYYVAFDLNKIGNNEFEPQPYSTSANVKTHKKRLFIPQFNRISLLMPKVALLPQRDELTEDIFCNNETMQGKDCRTVQCKCLHGIKIPLGAVVEIIFVDEGVSFDINHPLHLHGYHFRVVAMERVAKSITVDEVKAKDAAGQIYRNLNDAPLKDTVTVPDGGYTIVRFHATSPGYWMLHCHIEIHLALGMAMILQIGEKYEMAPVPENLPKCGDYVPDISSNFKLFENSGKIYRYNSVLYIEMALFVYLYYDRILIR